PEADDAVKALLGFRRERASHDQEAEAQPAGDQGEREEVEPAHDVLPGRRAGGAERLRRWGRAVPDPEGEDAGDNVAVGGDDPPADGVGTPSETADRRRHDPPVR